MDEWPSLVQPVIYFPNGILHGNCIKHLDITINFQCWKEGNDVYVHNRFGIPRYLNEEEVVFSYNTFKIRIIQATRSRALSDQLTPAKKVTSSGARPDAKD